MADHTPGPWVKATRALIVTKDAWRLPIAICYDKNHSIGGPDTDVADANCNLIAAAPDLLDALIIALPYVEDVAQFDETYKKGAVAKVVKQMRDAIEKAGVK